MVVWTSWRLGGATAPFPAGQDIGRSPSRRSWTPVRSADRAGCRASSWRGGVRLAPQRQGAGRWCRACTDLASSAGCGSGSRWRPWPWPSAPAAVTLDRCRPRRRPPRARPPTVVDDLDHDDHDDGDHHDDGRPHDHQTADGRDPAAARPARHRAGPHADGGDRRRHPRPPVQPGERVAFHESNHDGARGLEAVPTGRAADGAGDRGTAGRGPRPRPTWSSIPRSRSRHRSRGP